MALWSTKCRKEAYFAFPLTIKEKAKLRILMDAGCLEKAMKYVMDRILFFLRKRGGDQFQMECMTYCNQNGLLAKSDGAEKLLEVLKAWR